MEYEGPAFWLPLIWSGLLALAVAMYAVIDGLNLGILFTAARKGGRRGRMMLSVAPIRDGDETWLVLDGGGPFAVFGVRHMVREEDLGRRRDPGAAQERAIPRPRHQLVPLHRAAAQDDLAGRQRGS